MAEISPIFTVASEIYRRSEIEKKPSSFSELEKTIDSVTLSKALDILTDLGIIYTKWEEQNNKWNQVYGICKESIEFIAGIHNSPNN